MSFDQLNCLCQAKLIWWKWTPHLGYEGQLQSLLKAEKDFVDNQIHVRANKKKKKSLPSVYGLTNTGLA